MGRGETQNSNSFLVKIIIVPVGFLVSKTSCVSPPQERRPRHFLIGCIGVSGKTKWDVLDGVVRRLFKVNRKA